MRISVRGVAKRFGAQAAVDAVDLEIADGELFTLLGPSGCGKTTLLRLLAGFYRPDSGDIFFDERRMNDVPPEERQVGMVFQNYALWPHMTVAENIGYGLKLRKIARAEIAKRVHAVLTKVGLEKLDARYPGQISGGQQQRVALARALVLNPGILLMDEPLSNLDAKIRIQVRAEIRKLQKELGITAVYVTHDQEEALALSDIVAVMDRGRIVQVGAPMEIYANPATGYAADFLGSANLIPAGDGRFTVARREEIEIGKGDLKGRIEGVEFRGSVTGYRVRTDFGVVHVDVWSVQHGRTYTRGEEVRLRIRDDARVVEKS